MLDHAATQLALRVRAMTLSVATTGSATLAATATGYTRAAGSFLADGFAVGMEVNVTGFNTAANNGAGVVQAVSAGVLTVDAYTVASTSTGGYTVTARVMAVEAAGAGRTVDAPLPALRAWDNKEFTPVAGRWFVEEDYLAGPVAQETVGPLGQVESLPQYILKVYALANTGITAAGRTADALLRLFAPRTALTLSTGDVVTVRTNPAPYRSQLLPADGWAAIVVTIPCRARSANSI